MSYIKWNDPLTLSGGGNERRQPTPPDIETTITKRYHFESAHFLPNVPEGHKCKRVHGHNYEVEITVGGPVDFTSGWIVDFFDLDAMVQPLRTALDHRCLNDLPGLDNPTAEKIAHWFLVQLIASKLPNGVSVRMIRVYETKDCWATLTA